MYDMMRRHYYWTQGANDVYSYLEIVLTAKDTDKFRKIRGCYSCFPPEDLLQLASMDILGPLSKMKSDNRFVIVITDCFSKLTKAVPTNPAAAAHMAKES